MPPVICPRSRSAAESPVAAPKIRKKASWKALVSTFIWLARIPMPTRMSCLPRIMSKESEMENTLVPPWKGAKPRSPKDQKPPTIVELRPQLMQSLVDCVTTPAGAFGHLLFRLAPRMPRLADSQERSPEERMWLKMLLNPTVIGLMVVELKMWFSDTATFRPWLLMFWVLAKVLASAKP